MSRSATLLHLLIILTLVVRYASPSLADARPAKHFHEHPLAGHLDLRFGPTAPLLGPTVAHHPNYTELHDLLHSYVLTMRDLGVETWLAHGTLLRWHWGDHPLPWHLDIDVHVWLEQAKSPTRESRLGMGFLARYYNMTVHRYRRVAYLLDIDPAFAERAEAEGKEVDSNTIDARWVNMQTGVYIGVTALSAHRDGAGKQVGFRAKDGDAYLEEHVTPLRRSTFEGFEVLVPQAPERVLAQEYGETSLMMRGFKGINLTTAQNDGPRLGPLRDKEN